MIDVKTVKSLGIIGSNGGLDLKYVRAALDSLNIDFSFLDFDNILGGGNFFLGPLKDNTRALLSFSREIDTDVPNFACIWMPVDFRSMKPHGQGVDEDFKEAKINAIYSLTVIDSAFPECRFINKMASTMAANNLVFQLWNAKLSGLPVADTIVTNNYNQAAEFIQLNKSCLLRPTWNFDFPFCQESEINHFTSAPLSSLKGIDPAIITYAPMVYQKTIQAASCVRIVAFGNVMYAISIPNGCKLVRGSFYSDNLKSINLVSIPENIKTGVSNFMQRIDLLFCIFNFNVSRQNEWEFFAAEPSGQFLWQELYCPEVKLLSKFCEFLLSNTHLSTNLKDVDNISLEEIIYECEIS